MLHMITLVQTFAAPNSKYIGMCYWTSLIHQASCSLVHMEANSAAGGVAGAAGPRAYFSWCLLANGALVQACAFGPPWLLAWSGRGCFRNKADRKLTAMPQT